MPYTPNGDSEQPVGQNSTIRVGLGLIMASYIAMSSWWASAMNSKLSVVISGQQAANGDVTALRGKVEILERTADQFTQFGSPALRVRLDVVEKALERLNTIGCPASVEIRKRLEQLEKDLELHKVSNGKGTY